MSQQIYELIPKVMKDIGAVSKERRNTQQNYAFRGIEDFYYAAQPAMVEHGIFCVPKVVEREAYRFEKTNDQGRTTTWLHVALKVEHHFYAGDGSTLPVPVTTWGEGLDNSDKATNKAMSAAMKYALIELFCVPTKDVEDADRDSPEAGIQRSTAPRTFGKVSESVGLPLVKEPPSNSADPGTVADSGLIEDLKTSIEYISAGQAANLHKQFRKEVELYHPAKALESDDFLAEWLKQRGYVDKDGKRGTASRIPASGWFKVRDEALAYAKTLKIAQ